MNLIPNSGPAVAALLRLSAWILAEMLQSGRESPMIRALATAALRLDVHERNDETYFILEGESQLQVVSQTISAHAGDYAFGLRNARDS